MDTPALTPRQILEQLRAVATAPAVRTLAPSPVKLALDLGLQLIEHQVARWEQQDQEKHAAIAMFRRVTEGEDPQKLLEEALERFGPRPH